MFRDKRYRIAIALAVLSAPILAGCGSGGAPVAPGTPGVGGYQNGYYWGTGSCAPISTPISFNIQNVYVDSANIVGGNFPYSGQGIGQVMVGGAGGYQQPYPGQPYPGQPYPGSYGQQQLSTSTADGQLTLNITSMQQQQWQPYAQYPQHTYGQNPYYNQYGNNTNSSSGTGTLMISPSTQQEIFYSVQSGQIQIPGFQYGGMGGYPPYAGSPYSGNPGAWNPATPPGSYYPAPGIQQQICVSSVALNLGRWGTRLYGGKLYVYLNNTNHGIVLNF